MKTAIALGTFDGVHIGHKVVINAAKKSGFSPVVVAFPEAPRGIITGEKSVLTLPSQKKEILLSLGAHSVYYLEFSKVRDMSPTEFLEFLVCEFDPAFITCGFNYRFGKNGRGDVSTIRDFCNERGIEFAEISPVSEEGTVVSSTAIRKLLEIGEIENANRLLSRPFSFSAPVIHGDERGRTIGFPTINQVYPPNLVAVKFGVYKSVVAIGDKKYNGITNIGVRPTFQNGLVSAETYIIGFDGNLYGATVKLELLRFIRSERKFSSVDELKANIESDIQAANLK